jgi:hypothetical protein
MNGCSRINNQEVVCSEEARYVGGNQVSKDAFGHGMITQRGAVRESNVSHGEFQAGGGLLAQLGRPPQRYTQRIAKVLNYFSYYTDTSVRADTGRGDL